MSKIDLKRTLPFYSAQVGSFDLVRLPAMHYVMVDGQGDPNTSNQFKQAVESLYPIAYGVKFASKQLLNRDYVVMPLEGLWWADDMSSFDSRRNKSAWKWTMMIMQPEWIDQAMVDKVALAKKVSCPIRFERLEEELVVQTLHVGSFDQEGPVLKQMHDSYIPEHGLVMRGKHHEIYMSDFRKTDPSKLKTILRQPVSRIG